MSNAALSLLKETSRPSAAGWIFNYQLFSSSLSDIINLFGEAQKIILKSAIDPVEEPLSISDRNLLLVYHSTILRIQRILTACLMKQMHKLLTFNRDYSPINKQEVELIQSYENSINIVRNTFPSLDLFVHGCTVSEGPRKLYSLIRVIEDCGTIQTELGFLSLKQDSLHFVRVDDIRHLIFQGKLIILE